MTSRASQDRHAWTSLGAPRASPAYVVPSMSTDMLMLPMLPAARFSAAAEASALSSAGDKGESGPGQASRHCNVLSETLPLSWTGHSWPRPPTSRKHPYNLLLSVRSGKRTQTCQCPITCFPHFPLSHLLPPLPLLSKERDPRQQSTDPGSGRCTDTCSTSRPTLTKHLPAHWAGEPDMRKPQSLPLRTCLSCSSASAGWVLKERVCLPSVWPGTCDPFQPDHL